ncbi:PREDICTED: uncharacterized protein LOC106910059 [Poecilia mexicana]|uniref:uncharacterized protein LOC106910059 n=1 Tax=Poecilia mexicana TaxID=48701 RepID=UPI00072E8DAF|nr:PREDICTED: uncharacterized protein LOC106910059 [Poecilia mexicana]
MGIKIVSVLASVVAFSSWSYYFPVDKPTDQVHFPLQIQPIKKVEKQGRKLKEQQIEVVKQKDFKAEPVIEVSTPHRSEKLCFTSTVSTLSGSFPLGTVFTILLIHMCGADLVAAVSAGILHLFSISVFIDLVFGVITLYHINKMKREREELVKSNSELQRKLQVTEQDCRDEAATLQEVKNKLKTWMHHIRVTAEDMEAETEETKLKLQAQEKEVAIFNQSDNIMMVGNEMQVETGQT